MDFEIEVKGYETWKDFDRIVKLLKTKHNAVLIQKNDGPDARVYEFLIEDAVVLLIFDDMAGNSFRTKNKQFLDRTKLLIKEIERELSQASAK